MKLQAKARLLAEKFDDYIYRLRDSGIKRLGDGAHGEVFVHPTDPTIAVKIVSKDSANRLWLNFCETQQENPFVVKIHHIQDIELEDTRKAYAVFMERLKPMTELRYNKFLRSVDLGNRLAEAANYAWVFIANDKRFWEEAAKGTKDANLAKVAYYLSKTQRRLDMNEDNFMLRGNQIVFVDPLSP